MHNVSPVVLFWGGEQLGWWGGHAVDLISESELDVAVLAEAMFQPFPCEGAAAPAAILWSLAAVIKFAV